MAINDTVTNLFPNKDQFERIAVALEGMASSGNASADGIFRGMLTGANATHVMKAWFDYNGASQLADLTLLCDRWYSIARIGWTGGTTFNDPSVTDISTGTRVRDNAGMMCEPSTNTYAGRDDFAGLPLFACVDCNWYIDDDGETHITAIDGINSANPFSRADPARFVGVLQMAGWCKVLEDTASYTYMYTDQIGAAGYYPLPEAVRMDGTVRPWVVHVKYVAGDDMGSYSGVAPRAWDLSHNTCLTEFHTRRGMRYCGGTSADGAFLKWMVYLKYASLTLDGIMNGCVSYRYTNYKPAVAETGVQRVLLTAAQAANLLVGSTVCLGTAAYTSKANQCSVVDRKRIVSITTVNVSGTDYAAINIDNGGMTFDTTTALFLTTMQWFAGSCDKVKGNDGSPTNPTGGKSPAMVQGIEILMGGYDIVCDCILNYTNDGTTSHVKPHVCRDATKLATSITADYKGWTLDLECPTGVTADSYVKKLGRDNTRPEIMFPIIGDGSSTSYSRNAAYLRGGTALTGNSEWLSLGDLNTGEKAGLSRLHADNILSGASWWILARLSATGNRGEWAV